MTPSDIKNKEFHKMVENMSMLKSISSKIIKEFDKLCFGYDVENKEEIKDFIRGLMNKKLDDKVNNNKDDRISWYSAKNNAVDITNALIGIGKIRDPEKNIIYWANWLYELEPINKKT